MKLCINVLVQFLSEDEGGRKSLLYLNGYRPHFRVIGDTEYLGIQFIEGTDKIINPKEWISSKVYLIYYPNVSYEKLRIGKEFEILEGAKIVGIGTVISPVTIEE